MIALLVVAHKEISNNYISCVEHITGKLPSNLFGFGVDNNIDVDILRKSLSTKIDELLIKYSEVLILNDLFGATPSNIALDMFHASKVEILSGLNMSMLLRALNYSNSSLCDCMDKAFIGGLAGIVKNSNEAEVCCI